MSLTNHLRWRAHQQESIRNWVLIQEIQVSFKQIQITFTQFRAQKIPLLCWRFKHTQVIFVLLQITTLFCQTIMTFAFTAYLILFPSMMKTQQKIILASFQRLIQIFCFTFIRLTDLHKWPTLVYVQFHLICRKCFRNPSIKLHRATVPL